MHKLDGKMIHCVWSKVSVGDGTTKVPYVATSILDGFPYQLSTKKPENWCVKSVVDKAIAKDGDFSQGIVLGEIPESEYALIGIDIDGTNIGVVNDIAMEVVSEWDTYTEVSPSGEGMKLFALMKTEDAADIPMKQKWTKTASAGGHVEMTFHRGRRFFAVTGLSLFGYEDLNVVTLATVTKFIKETQPKFIEATREYATARKEGGSGKGGFGDRSSMVLGFIAAELRKDLDLDRDEIYENILSSDDKSDAIELVRSWVEEKQTSTTGERELERAYNRVRDNLEEYDIYDAEENPAFAPIEDEDEPIEADTWLNRMNNRYGAVDVNGKLMVLKWHDNGLFNLMDMASFKVDSAPAGMAVSTATGKPARVADAWLDHPKHRRFDGMGFDPSAAGKPIYEGDRKLFNICPPWPLEPVDGDASPAVKIITDSLCGDDADSAEWLLDYLAHMVQRPSERPSIHPILYGPMGTGKDALVSLMARILPNRTVVEYDFEGGSVFNGRLGTALMVNVPEAVQLTSRKVEAKLKDFLTKKTMEVNEKFKPEYQVPFHARVFFTTNDVAALPVSAGDRRYVPIKSVDTWSSTSMSNSPEEVKSFWDAYWEGFVKKGGAGVFFKFLLDRDITGFSVDSIPKFARAAGSLRQDMIIAQTSVEMEAAIEILGTDSQFMHESPTGITYILPSEGRQLAVDINSRRDKFKQGHRTERQWALVMTETLDAKTHPVKIDGKLVKVWKIDIEKSRKKISLAMSCDPFDGNVEG